MQSKLITMIALGMTLLLCFAVWASISSLRHCAYNPDQSFHDQYTALKCTRNLKFRSYEEAVAAFQASAGTQIEVSGLAPNAGVGVGGSERSPYLFGQAVIDTRANKCLKAKIYLVDGAVEKMVDACAVED